MHRATPLILCCLLGLSAQAGSAQAGSAQAGSAQAGSAEAGAQAVSVTFADTRTFTDATFHGGRASGEAQAALTEIRRYVEQLARENLAPHQSLSVEFLDIDLAGDLEPWRAVGADIRIMRDIYPPRFKVHYRLAEPGQTTREGESKIVDVNYLANASARFKHDPLRYEKALLSSWFRTVILGAHSTHLGWAPRLG